MRDQDRERSSGGEVQMDAPSVWLRIFDRLFRRSVNPLTRWLPRDKKGAVSLVAVATELPAGVTNTADAPRSRRLAA
jgi:hypothetical protein